MNHKEYCKFVEASSVKEFDLKYLALGLAGEVGEVCNEIKKMFRDNPVEADLKEAEYKLILELGDVMWYYTAILNKYKYDLDFILDMNIKKIRERIGLEKINYKNI